MAAHSGLIEVALDEKCIVFTLLTDGKSSVIQ